MKGEFPGSAGWKGRISNLGVAKLKSNAARAPSSALGWMWLMLVHVFGSMFLPSGRQAGRCLLGSLRLKSFLPQRPVAGKS